MLCIRMETRRRAEGFLRDAGSVCRPLIRGKRSFYIRLGADISHSVLVCSNTNIVDDGVISYVVLKRLELRHPVHHLR